MTVTKLYNPNESVKDCPHKYIKTLTADTNPTGVEAGSELWDAQADITYITPDGASWYEKKRAKYEHLSWSPGLKDTNDLEVATKSIIKTSEDSGVGNADYSILMSAAALPADARIAVAMAAAKSSLTIDSDDGTHDLRCRIYLDVQDSDHLLMDLTFSSTGSQLSVQNLSASTKAVIFNLLKDGGSHTWYWFFWTPGSHAPVISEVRLYYGLGASTGSETWNEVLEVTHVGMFQVMWEFTCVGSGNTEVWVIEPKGTVGYMMNLMQAGIMNASNYSIANNIILMSWSGFGLLQVNPTVATDLRYLNDFHLILRSE
jgi:hypothetical protein